MSFRIYLRAIADSSQTEIYNNTTLLGTYTDPQKIVLLGINYRLTEDNLAIVDSTSRYVNITLPVYTVAQHKTYFYRELSTATARAENYENLRKGLMSMGTDYILVYINSLDGYPVDRKIVHLLKQQFGATHIENKSSGGWMLLAKPHQMARFAVKGFRKLTEKYNSGSSIDLYYLTHTEFTYMNKVRWNELFHTNSSNLDIQNYYQALFDVLDPLIYDEESNYVQILSRIHHHIVHPRDDNFDGEITEGDGEIPYYTANPDELDVDRETLQQDVREINALAFRGGIEKFLAEGKRVLSQPFLSLDMINEMLDFRSLYIFVREEFYTKLEL